MIIKPNQKIKLFYDKEKYLLVFLLLTSSLLLGQNNPLDIYNTSPILNAYGQILSDGCILQVIYTGSDGQINQPVINFGQPNNGQVTGDDSLLYTSRVGNNVPPGTGLFYFTIVTYPNHASGYPANGDSIYVRVFNDTSLISSTSYGDADLFLVTNQLGSAYIVSVNILVNSNDEIFSSQIPKTYSLSQNYPNPFNPVTTIKYGLPKASNVILEIYNILGQRILTVVDDHETAGYHEAKLDATQFASGIYMYRIQAGEFSQVKKMVVMK